MATSTVNLNFYVSKYLWGKYIHRNLESTCFLQEINRQGTENFVCCPKFIERIVKVSVLNIIYHRLPIPEHFFDLKNFKSIPYRGIKREWTRTGIVQLYRKWMKGFKDAFRKKYLKEFILFFFDENQNIEENFRFKFKYEMGIAKDNTDLANVTESSRILLTNLIALGDMPKLPLDIQMHAELFYVQGTPEEYISPYFNHEDYLATFKSKMEHQHNIYTTLAKFDTGSHHLKFSFNRKSNDSQFLKDVEIQQKIEKRKYIAENDADESIGEKRGKWEISDSKILLSTIVSDQSREGVSFNLDYEGISVADGNDSIGLDEFDLEVIANAMKKND